MLTFQVPAQIEKAPALGREITFPGFNAFPLKGSLLAGGAHGYFAVMVAGSGPTDRDWASRLMPIGHAGRDFALWLQTQGIEATVAYQVLASDYAGQANQMHIKSKASQQKKAANSVEHVAPQRQARHLTA